MHGLQGRGEEVGILPLYLQPLHTAPRVNPRHQHDITATFPCNIPCHASFSCLPATTTEGTGKLQALNLAPTGSGLPLARRPVSLYVKAQRSFCQPPRY